MREVKTDNYTFKVRALTRGELKELRKAGYNLADLTLAEAEDAVDYSFQLIFSDQENLLIDELPNLIALKLWNAILAETYGDPAEEKNLLRSGPGTQTATD